MNTHILLLFTLYTLGATLAPVFSVPFTQNIYDQDGLWFTSAGTVFYNKQEQWIGLNSTGVLRPEVRMP